MIHRRKKGKQPNTNPNVPNIYSGQNNNGEHRFLNTGNVDGGKQKQMWG